MAALVTPAVFAGIAADPGSGDRPDAGGDRSDGFGGDGRRFPVTNIQLNHGRHESRPGLVAVPPFVQFPAAMDAIACGQDVGRGVQEQDHVVSPAGGGEQRRTQGASDRAELGQTVQWPAIGDDGHRTPARPEPRLPRAATSLIISSAASTHA
jgi:hypothetical protein